MPQRRELEAVLDVLRPGGPYDSPARRRSRRLPPPLPSRPPSSAAPDALNTEHRPADLVPPDSAVQLVRARLDATVDDLVGLRPRGTVWKPKDSRRNQVRALILIIRRFGRRSSSSRRRAGAP